MSPTLTQIAFYAVQTNTWREATTMLAAFGTDNFHEPAPNTDTGSETLLPRLVKRVYDAEYIEHDSHKAMLLVNDILTLIRYDTLWYLSVFTPCRTEVELTPTPESVLQVLLGAKQLPAGKRTIVLDGNPNTVVGEFLTLAAKYDLELARHIKEDLGDDTIFTSIYNLVLRAKHATATNAVPLPNVFVSNSPVHTTDGMFKIQIADARAEGADKLFGTNCTLYYAPSNGGDKYKALESVVVIRSEEKIYGLFKPVLKGEDLFALRTSLLNLNKFWAMKITPATLCGIGLSEATITFDSVRIK